ncbi:MAG: hypothetical protein WBB37_05020 [bacterium]
MGKYQDNILDIISNAEKYHSAFYQYEIFSGPSLYSHRKSLQERDSDNFEHYLKYVYATLASWGMHRMGKGGSKMQPFEIYKESIVKLRAEIEEAKKTDYKDINDSDWKLLKKIFKGINVMASETSLVGNSKAMAHMIPNICPPIDREYTLRYQRDTTNINNGIEEKWGLMKEIIFEFFIPVGKDTNFISKANKWMLRKSDFPWDTSILKVIDNLVIGAGKLVKESKTRKHST